MIMTDKQLDDEIRRAADTIGAQATVIAENTANDPLRTARMLQRAAAQLCDLLERRAARVRTEVADA
jgi:hypothetical protein